MLKGWLSPEIFVTPIAQMANHLTPELSLAHDDSWFDPGIPMPPYPGMLGHTEEEWEMIKQLVAEAIPWWLRMG